MAFESKQNTPPKPMGGYSKDAIKKMAVPMLEQCYNGYVVNHCCGA